MTPKFYQKDYQKALDLLGQLITERVRDAAVGKILGELNGAAPTERYIQKGLEKMSSAEREFVKETVLPYAADAVIFYFLDLLETVDARPFSPDGVEEVIDGSESPDEAVRFNFLLKKGDDDACSVADLAPVALSVAPARLPDCLLEGWNERFGHFPSSSIYRPDGGQDEQERQ